MLEFVNSLIYNGYMYLKHIDGGLEVIGGKSGDRWPEEHMNVTLPDVRDIFERVIFSNKRDVTLPDLVKISGNVTFNNDGHVFLPELKSLPGSVRFDNRGEVYMPRFEIE